VTLVDVGDAVQGDVIGTLSSGEWIIQIMNEVGYDFAVPGNHEFDYGMEQFLALAELAEFPYLCVNFVDQATGERVFEPYSIVDYSGMKVAFLGIDTPEAIMKSDPTHFQNERGEYVYNFRNGGQGQELYDCVQQAVDEARGEGADYVVAMAHLGIDNGSSPWTSLEVIANTTGIDVMLDGHSHDTVACQEVKNQDGKPVLLSQTGTKFAAIGKLAIGGDGVLSTELITDYGDRDNASYKSTQELIQSIQADYSEMISETIAVSEVPLVFGNEDESQWLIRTEETNLGDLCADAYRTIMDADVAFVNGGGIRGPIGAGDVTYGDIIQVHPYSNMICLVEVTGQQLLDALEFAYRNAGNGEDGNFLQISGMKVTVDTGIPSSVELDENKMFVSVAGQRRVVSAQVWDEEQSSFVDIDANEHYTLASHDYMLYSQGGGFTMFGKENVAVLKDASYVDSQVLIDYITQALGGTISEAQYGHSDGRVNIVGE